jgi:Transposase, Mutator family
VEEALEGEAGDAVGRDYYEHGAQPGQGYRNGYRTGRLKTAGGLMEYSTPQIAGRDEPFRSAIREHLKGHTQGLENLAIEMLARGLSVRDIEDAFKDIPALVSLSGGNPALQPLAPLPRVGPPYRPCLCAGDPRQHGPIMVRPTRLADTEPEADRSARRSASERRPQYVPCSKGLSCASRASPVASAIWRARGYLAWQQQRPRISAFRRPTSFQ